MSWKDTWDKPQCVTPSDEHGQLTCCIFLYEYASGDVLVLQLPVHGEKCPQTLHAQSVDGPLTTSFLRAVAAS